MKELQKYHIIALVIIIIFSFSSCFNTNAEINKIKSLNINYKAWRMDTLGCKDLREGIIDSILSNEKNLIGITDKNIKLFFGTPDFIHSKTPYIEYLSKGILYQEVYSYKLSGCKNDSVFQYVDFNIEHRRLSRIKKEFVCGG